MLYTLDQSVFTFFQCAQLRVVFLLLRNCPILWYKIDCNAFSWSDNIFMYTAWDLKYEEECAILRLYLKPI